MHNLHPGDVVSVTVRRNAGPHTGPSCGLVRGTVVAVSGGEFCLKPSDWDQACDVINREGTMEWTEIRDIRDVGVLDAVEDDANVAVVSRSASRAAEIMHAAIEAAFAEIVEEYGLESGDETPEARQTITSMISVAESFVTNNL